MSAIAVVVNPAAGRNLRVRGRAGQLGAVLGTHGWVREPRSLEQLEEVAEECRQRGVAVLGVCGGDGTLARTLTALVRVYGSDALPTILPLRAGTMNTVARAVGCSRWQPERMLAEIVEEYRRGESLPLTVHQLLSVNDTHYGFMVGAGVPVAFLRHYYERPTRGAVAAFRTLARLSGAALVGGSAMRAMFRRIPARLQLDDAPVPFDAVTVVYASTIEDIGLGFRPTYRARERAGAFHLFAGSIGPRALVGCLPAIRLGRPTRSPAVHDALGARLCVEFAEPTHYMVDGDIMEPTTRLEVALGPVVRVIRR